ncbi:hypothetical protein G4X40_20100 [Rhodococcus sp. D2-41]|uniref:hypothetical protein n=1 Tax=Speluncibacter jeojiensis TaxID=2710754 RepID=UPI0024100089|nr:hypothetical protein [Rhodococcus sp. D2-41]MDG3012446.1 hypothetical protein [Rhodococcus sp. D2-41]
MTTPGGHAPDGAWVVGSRYGQDITEASAEELMTRPGRTAYEAAAGSFREWREQYRSSIANMKDGQLALNGRTDLLKNVSGYGCAVMGRNWQLPHGSMVVMPFDRQVGPTKHVSIVSEDQYHGRLCLKAGGLWRVDALLSLRYQAFTRQVTLEPLYPGGPMIVHTYDYEKTVTPSYTIEVLDSQGNVFSPKVFQGTSAVTNWWAKDSGGSPTRSQSNAFSTTFVVPEMPPEDDPDAPNHWCYVRVSAQWTSVAQPNSLFSDSFGKFLGGTEKSGLYASRWSRDVNHVNYQPTVPDGGTLS